MITILKRAWHLFTKTAPGKAQAELAKKYAHFQKLLSANNQVLSLMADMEEKLSGEYLFDLQYIRATIQQLRQFVSLMVEALNALGGNQYQALTHSWLSLSSTLEEELNSRREIPATPLVFFLDMIDAPMADVVGQKNARLGEIQNCLKLPVPPAFAVSLYAYKVFLDYNRLTRRIPELLEHRRLDDLDSLHHVSQEIQGMILTAQVPPELHQALREAYDKLADLTQQRPGLALRPSIIGEELAFTFADRYRSYLNVPLGEMESCYKLLLAGLFPPRAVFYLKNKGFKEEELACGVTVMPMIHAKVGGVLFTHPLQSSASEAALVLAGWGISPDASLDAVGRDRYLLAYQPRGRVVEKVIASKPMMWICRPDAGLEEVPVHRDYLQAACLQDRQHTQLLDWAEALEGRYRQAQMVEWAMDWQNQLWLLNCQSLHVPQHQVASSSLRNVKDYPIVLDQGTVAYRGVAGGPVVLITRDEDLEDFPEGGVLVAKHSSPSYVKVMPNAAAILTDAGSPTGHMAVLAREFQVPTILDTGRASQVLRPGQVVTVDANYGNVYDGLIPELIQPREPSNGLGDSPVFLTLKALIRKIVPLNLITPGDETTFRPENCRTLHDIVRYAHEFSMREMFKLTEDETWTAGEAVDLIGELPFKVRILDLGGGLKRVWRRKIQPDQIVSVPFRAFWEGLSAMSRSSAGSGDDTAALSWPRQSLAILSQNYMNFRINLGLDLLTVEAYLSDQVNDNYIAFGCQTDNSASTPELRKRWARFIKAILNRLEFSQRQEGEVIEARFAKYSQEKMAWPLIILGKLTYYGKQLDQALISDNIVDWYIKDFVQEHLEN